MVLFFSSAAVAATPNALLLKVQDLREAGSKNSVINQVIYDSGMGHMIEQLPAMVAMGFDQQPLPPISRNKFDKFRESYIQSFDPEKTRKTIKDSFGAQYEEQRFSELLTLMNSHLAKKRRR